MSSQDAKLLILSLSSYQGGATFQFTTAPPVIVNNPDGTKSLLDPGRKNFSALQHSHYTERLDAQRLKRELKQG